MEEKKRFCVICGKPMPTVYLSGGEIRPWCSLKCRKGYEADCARKAKGTDRKFVKKDMPEEHEPVWRICPICGVEFDAWHVKTSWGYMKQVVLRKYCSTRCMLKANELRTAERRKAATPKPEPEPVPEPKPEKKKAGRKRKDEVEGITTRHCHDCGAVTNNFRCAECLKKWRLKHGVSLHDDDDCYYY